MKRQITMLLLALYFVTATHTQAGDRARCKPLRTGITIGTNTPVVPMVPAYTRPGARQIYISPYPPYTIGIPVEPRHRSTCDCNECTTTPRPPKYLCDDGVKRPPRDMYIDNYNWCLKIYDPTSGWYTDRKKHIKSTVTLFWHAKEKGWCFYHDGLLHWYDSRDAEVLDH